jgi:glycosyltransferase involved in cell wall biosynthesis
MALPAPAAAPLRVAMLAPPWIPVPAPAYGGIEEVVRLLCEGLVERGHDVTLLAPPGSTSTARVHVPLDDAHPEEIQSAQIEADHVARSFAMVEAEGFDILHDHAGFVALAMADRVDVPIVHTLHGPFDGATSEFYRAHGHKAQLVALSAFQCDNAPDEAGEPAIIPNPLRVSEWPFTAEKEDWLLWIGRMSPDKGPQRAIAAARAAGVQVLLAGPIQPGQEEFFASEVEPHVDGDTVVYLGEADSETKRDLYRRARGLLMPIRWPEPFGLVMIEAMACGTPVIAFPEGSVPELIRNGETGFVVDDEDAMAQAVERLGEIDPAHCRAVTEERFGVDAVVERYEALYRSVIPAQPRGSTPRPAAGASGSARTRSR